MKKKYKKRGRDRERYKEREKRKKKEFWFPDQNSENKLSGTNIREQTFGS